MFEDRGQSIFPHPASAWWIPAGVSTSARFHCNTTSGADCFMTFLPDKSIIRHHVVGASPAAHGDQQFAQNHQ